MVAAAVGFGDEGADFALAAFEVAVGEGVEGVADLLGEGFGLGVGGGLLGWGVFEGSGEEDAALLVGGGFEGVVGRGGVGEGLEDGCGGERVVPGGVLHEGVGGEGAGGIVLRGGRGRGGGCARSR